jgi:hypothetical protein
LKQALQTMKKTGQVGLSITHPWSLHFGQSGLGFGAGRAFISPHMRERISA